MPRCVIHSPPSVPFTQWGNYLVSIVFLQYFSAFGSFPGPYFQLEFSAKVGLSQHNITNWWGKKYLIHILVFKVIGYDTTNIKLLFVYFVACCSMLLFFSIVLIQIVIILFLWKVVGIQPIVLYFWGNLWGRLDFFRHVLVALTSGLRLIEIFGIWRGHEGSHQTGMFHILHDLLNPIFQGFIPSLSSLLFSP